MTGGNVVDLTARREEGLTERQRDVLHRVQAGSDCQLCGDLGAWNPAQQRGAPCMACGKVGEL